MALGTKTNEQAEAMPQIDKVLVVDDDDNWCFVTKILLEDSGVGKQILTAQNGEEAINLLKAIAANEESMPELIILDIKMPVMDGFEFLDEVVNSEEFDLAQTKIFLSSSSSHIKDKEKAKEYPIAGFVKKPLTEEFLREILD